MNYDKILAALETTLTTVENVPDIAFETVDYDPSVGTPYIKTLFLPADRRPRSLGIDIDNKPFFQRYEGIFQLLLHYPSDKGQHATNTMVNAIIDKFEATTDLEFGGVYVTIKQVERMKGMTESPWFKTPVNIHWYSYSK